MSATTEGLRRNGLARPIKGPTALGDDPRRFVRLVLALALTEFKLRFFGSALGYLWSLMRPLLLFGVLYTVFSLFLEFGDEVEYYPVALLLGIIMYSFLQEATTSATRSLVTRENLVRKVDFPRAAVPAAAVLTAVLNLALNLVPVLIFLVASGGGTPRLSWLEFPFLLLGLILFAFGLAMLLSALFVRYRDVEPLWDVFMQILFYATPILYTVQLVADKSSETVAHTMVMINPLAVLMQQSRHAFVDPSHLSAADAVGGAQYLLVPLAIVVVTVALGMWVFAREAPRVAEDL